MNCTNCKFLLTRKRVDGEIENICLLSHGLVKLIVECNKWQLEEAEAKKGK